MTFKLLLNTFIYIKLIYHRKGMSSGMRLKLIKDYLRTKFIAVPDQWLLNQINGNDCNQESVYRFWLNSDLRTIATSVLPNDISRIKVDDNKQTAIKSTLNGKYALQVFKLFIILKFYFNTFCANF